MTSASHPADSALALATAVTDTAVAAAVAPPDTPHVAPTAGRSTAAPDSPLAASAVEQVPVPTDQAGIDALRLQIDAADAEIVRLIKRRTAISHAIGTARKSLGGPRIVYSREMVILERFRELGPEGTDLGMMLLAMGRGQLGRK